MFKHRHVQAVDIQCDEAVDNQQVFISQRLNWKTAGTAFGDLPSFADRQACLEELRGLIGDPKTFEKFFDQKILTGPEFAKLLEECG